MWFISGKTVLVTGGGGSIGSELCRQIAAHSPKQLIIFDVYENNAYNIQLELKEKYPDLNLETLIGSVRDSRRMYDIFETYHPQIVYHAAAHKHVPLMEDSPCESIVDFYCAKARLVVEIDGSQHYEAAGRKDDEARDSYLQGWGLKILRFSNHDVDCRFQSVCETIDLAVREDS